MNPRRILFFSLVVLISQPIIAEAGAPPGPDDLETAVTLMTKIGSCGSPTFSPDGTRLAFVSDLNGVPQVWTVPTEGGWPNLVTALGDPIWKVSWSPDGSWLAFSLDPGGGMNSQVYLTHPDGTGLRRLTDGGKENNWLGDWTHDGRALMLASNRRSADAMDAYLVDPTDGKLQLITQNQGFGRFTDVSRDGRHALLYRMLSRGDDNLFLVDLANGHETLLTPHEGPGSFHGAMSPEGRTVYLLSNKDRDLAAFARIKLSQNNRPGPIEILAARDDAELHSFEINEQGTTAALVWNVAGRSELTFLDLATLQLARAPDLPAEGVRGLKFSKDGNLLAMGAAGAAAPLDIWVLNLKEGRFHQVTRSPHAGVDLARLVRPELVKFLARDGIELSGWLYRPRGITGPAPIVLSFHGGPEGQELPSFLHSEYQALLSQGIGVFAPNVRGSSGFGKKFVNLDNGPLRVNAVSDIKASVDYLVKAGIADPKRVGIMGGSYGGYMTMAGLTEYPELFAAGADFFGVVNFETFFAHTEPWMAAISTVEYGNPKTQAEMLRQLSPLYKIDRVKAATIVLHGANDTNVPVVEAEQVVDSLKKRGIRVEYVLFPDEGHGFAKTSNRIRSTVSMVRWFVKYLKGSDDNPAH
ncbi:MAG: S9 family peptidase [Acidobacteria bacterium]|nr:S9 family peptidase [Acidobacteriota bacterium]